jgi:hypothetical protein
MKAPDAALKDRSSTLSSSTLSPSTLSSSTLSSSTLSSSRRALPAELFRADAELSFESYIGDGDVGVLMVPLGGDAVEGEPEVFTLTRN